MSSFSLAVGALVACSSNSAPIGDPSPAPSSTTPANVTVAKSDLPRDPPSAAAIPGAVAANNAFAADLLNRVGAATPHDNVLISPLSASFALTITYAGAKGQTADEMATALHFGSARASIFDGQNALAQALAQRPQTALASDVETAKESGQATPDPSDYALDVVNAVWGEQTYTWESPFLDVLAKSYGTGVEQVDFLHQSDAAKTTINDWVSAQTAGKIKNLLPSLAPSTRMVLVNAAHLKLPFADSFQAFASAPAPFTKADGATVSPTFMNKTANLAYADDGKAQIVALPLAGGQVSVVVALPHGDVAAYEAALAAGSATLDVPHASKLVALSLPKTTFTTPSFSMNGGLAAMGMQRAFDLGAADFTGMCAHPPTAERLYIGDVLQKATMTVQETGVEAAAATAVIVDADGGIAIDAGPPAMPIPVVVNKPYVIAIVDELTHAILFVGHIADPTAVGGQ